MAGSRRTAWKGCWALSGRPPSPGLQAEAPRRAATAGRAAAGPSAGPRRSPRHRSAASRRVPALLGIPGPAGSHKPPASPAGPRNPGPARPHSPRPSGSRRVPAAPGTPGPVRPRIPGPAGPGRNPQPPAPLTMARECGSRQRALPLGSGSGGITLMERAGEGGCGSMRRASAGHPI